MDWNPDSYARFRDLRLRPALDLLARVPDLPPGDVIDLGCGNGPVGAALEARFPDRRIVGVDSSPAMLDAAGATGAYADLAEADIATWRPDRPPALIFSNAALHWLPDHASLMPRLACLVALGGALAVQMPRQQTAPSHALLREIAARRHPDRFDVSDWSPQVSAPADYVAMLAPFGTTDLWETDYAQILQPVAEGHPVRAFTASTAMRPFLDPLDADAATAFLEDYDRELAAAYPSAADGTVLFPFRRLFFVVSVGGD